jgi:uncharacterized membrane protein
MRIELIHPMIVSFPIAFLFLGVALRLGAFLMRKKEIYLAILWFSRSVIGGGLVFAILALISGQIAHNYVHDQLCDHQVLENHQFFAGMTVIFFTLGLLMDCAKGWNRTIGILGFIFYWIGPIFLIMTGFYGGKLVFEQGAGVEKVCEKGAASDDSKPQHENED